MRSRHGRSQRGRVRYTPTATGDCIVFRPGRTARIAPHRLVLPEADRTTTRVRVCTDRWDTGLGVLTDPAAAPILSSSSPPGHEPNHRRFERKDHIVSDLEAIYEIARYSVDGDRLLERFEVLSDGTSVSRHSNDGSVTPLPEDTAAKAIAADPALREVRAGELTRITTTTLVDELPLILRAPGTYPDEDSDGDDLDEYDEYDNGPGAIYDDRTVEINGHSWFAVDGYLLPTARASASLAETWVDLAFDVGWTPFSNGVAWGVIGLLNPNVVVSIDPIWEGDGHVVSVRRRGGDAGNIRGWLLGFRPDDWGGGSGIDTERILAQLFIVAACPVHPGVVVDEWGRVLMAARHRGWRRAWCVRWTTSTSSSSTTTRSSWRPPGSRRCPAHR